MRFPFVRTLPVIRSRKIDAARMKEFLERGYRKRYVFPHSIYYLPKPGPDGFKLAYRMCQCKNLSHLYQILLFAENPVIDEFPDDLFFDDDLLWHQQQFGMKGQIATTTMVRQNNHLYCLAPHSDIVQRISRRREYKTRVEKIFKGWMHMLLNGVLNFAVENQLSGVLIPCSELALRNTDRKRTPGPLLFRRIYDEYVQQLFKIQRQGEWWYINVHENGNRIVRLDKDIAAQKRNNTISVCHNIPVQHSRKSLEQMLAVEKAFGVKATYQISGILHHEYRSAIEEDGHCVSFYSYDGTNKNQLLRCREIDYRIKGYCPFDCKSTRELTDFNLAVHNFEWVAGSYRSIKIKNGIARIPIRIDESSAAHFAKWKKTAISKIRSNDFTAVVLSNRNSASWLSHYEELLEELLKLGSIRTLNEISAQLFLTHSL